MSPLDTFEDIVGSDLPAEDKATMCALRAHELGEKTSGGDLAIPLWLAYAQMYATLACAEALAKGLA